MVRIFIENIIYMVHHYLPTVDEKWSSGGAAEKIVVTKRRKVPVFHHLSQYMLHTVGRRARGMEPFYSLCVLENLGVPCVGIIGKAVGMAWDVMAIPWKSCQEELSSLRLTGSCKDIYKGWVVHAKIIH